MIESLKPQEMAAALAVARERKDRQEPTRPEDLVRVVGYELRRLRRATFKRMHPISTTLARQIAKAAGLTLVEGD
jgi:hypothetical protein